MGDKAIFLRGLGTAERLHAPGLMLFRAIRRLEPIRDQPQFKAIEARMNFPPDHISIAHGVAGVVETVSRFAAKQPLVLTCVSLIIPYN
jgi:hypothetical protein